MKLKNIFTSPAIYYIFAIFFFKPTYLSYTNYNLINIFFKLGLYVVYIIIFLKYLLSDKLSKLILLELMMYGVLVVTSFIDNNLNIAKILPYFFNTIFLSAMFEIGFSENVKNLFKGLFYFFYSLMLINLISFFMYPSGLAMGLGINSQTIWYFLGAENDYTTIIIPAMLISIIYYMLNNRKNKFSFYTFMVNIIGTSIYIWSATLIVGLLIVAAYFFVSRFINLSNKLNVKTYVLIYIVIYILMTNIEKITIVKWFVEEILGKSVTFTGRTYIWEKAMKLIRASGRSLLCGYGSAQNGWVIPYKGLEWYAHNMILDILIQGGIFLLVAYLVLIFYSFSKIGKNSNTPASQVILIVIFALNICMLTESYFTKPIIFALLTIVCNSNIIAKSIENSSDMQVKKSG